MILDSSTLNGKFFIDITMKNIDKSKLGLNNINETNIVRCLYVVGKTLLLE